MSDQYLRSYRSLDVDESEEEVVAGPARLNFLYLQNRAAAERFVKVYDGLAASVVVGTTAPKLTFAIPASTTLPPIPVPKGGWSFDTGIVIAATTGIADADTGAPAANDVVVNLGYSR
jgi:hypothetical protein